MNSMEEKIKVVGFAGRVYHLDDYGECDECGQEQSLAVCGTGVYCAQCIPDEEVAFILRAVHRGF